MITKSDAQFLLSGVRAVITGIETQLKEGKAMNRVLYEMAEPNSDEGSYAFKALNSNRNAMREMRKTAKRLARVSKSLKEFIRS